MPAAGERVERALRDRKVARDVRVLGDFQAIYCRGNHAGGQRRPLESLGARLGAYGDRVPAVCEECAEFLRYAERRRALCPHDPKPQCKNCPKHCYRPAMRETARAVMRYAGPPAMFHGHAADSVAHMLDRPVRALRRLGGRPGGEEAAREMEGRTR
ncbi:MAG: nitrous oxide-stimulated promoter family protein [Coriobacteriia bacterium]|nr:nitrous oxide-stimulated promoter family protein [Coriobacteriia bacterium]